MNIIEIGANLGQDTEYYINIENSRVWAIEPLPFLIDKLKEKYKDRTNISFHQTAISDFNGEAKFGISNPNDGAKDWGCSSLLEFADNISEVWVRGDLHFIEYTKVPVIRMDTFIEQNHIDTIDFLHCDAQGNDIVVLKSFGEKLNILKSGKCEASNKIPLYKGVDNSLFAVMDFLESNGFKIDKIMGDDNIEIYRDKISESIQYQCDIHFSKI